MNLYLLPGPYANLDVSIYRAITATHLEKYVEKTILEKIIQKVGSNAVNCWAFSRGCRSNYDSMREGDILLFRENGTGTFSIKGQVADKTISKKLGNSIWPIRGGDPWDLIFFIKNIVNISIESARLFRDLGYEQNYWLPGAKRVADTRLKAAIRKYGSFDKFINGEGSAPAQGGNPRIIRRPGAGVRPPYTGQTMNPATLGAGYQNDNEDPWKI